MKRNRVWCHGRRLVSVLALVILCAGCGRAQPVLEPAGVLELPYAIQSMAWHPNGKWLAVGYFMRDEVEVWDVEAKKALFSVPSQRRPINKSGQEVLFSKDGKYLAVQDFLDTRSGMPKFPRSYEDPGELAAQDDKERYILARIWDMELRKETAQIKGPGSILYAAHLQGMCFAGAADHQIVLLRGTAISTYGIRSGEHRFTVHLRYPFADKPSFSWGYEKMSCHPTKNEVALEGGVLMRKAPEFGYPINSGATPIVVVDLERKAVKKVLFSATPLNGVAYTADGSKLISFGAPPIRVWDTNADFAPVGQIDDPHLNTGDFSPVPGYDGVFGIADDMHLWNTSVLKPVEKVVIPRDVFRVSLHRDSGLYAVASGRFAHFYRLNKTKLATLNAAFKE